MTSPFIIYQWLRHFIFDLIRTLFLLSHAKGLSCFTKIGNLMAKIFDPKEKNGLYSRSPQF